MLTYEEYAELGGSLEEDRFVLLEAKASARIHRMTHGRLRDETPVRDCVKYALMELIAAMDTDETEAGREAVSMSNDGLSVTYAQTSASARYAGIVRIWLEGEVTEDGVELLYCGVDA